MTDKKGLTTFQLKVFACLVMVIDHVSAIFMPFYSYDAPAMWANTLNNDILRGIGRLALPIFAFLIAEGCRHTRSLPRYCGRLFGFADDAAHALAGGAFCLRRALRLLFPPPVRHSALRGGARFRLLVFFFQTGILLFAFFSLFLFVYPCF